MHHAASVWEASLALIVALLLFDYFFHVRKAHVPSLVEAARWSAAYIAIALLFGAVLLLWGGTELGTAYFAAYVTEKALSVDNVFVFLVILSSLRVPREVQQKAASAASRRSYTCARRVSRCHRSCAP
ncbi:MAG: hypothetical protein ACHP7E_00835 [Burkholderiales bacterium]